MPEGIILMRWDERSGVNVVFKYPSDLDSDEMTMIQVYSQHQYSGEAGTVMLTVGPTNIVSYYSGPIKGYYVVLFLSEDEDPDDFESPIINNAQTILQNLKDSAYEEIIPEIFEKLNNYKDLTKEQHLCLIYANDMKRTIIKRLRDEAFVDKAELKAWLHDKYRATYIDSDAILVELAKDGIVKFSSITGRGLPTVSIFFINDIFTYRAPNYELMEKFKTKGLPEQYLEQFMELSENYFSNYTPSDEDNLKWITLLLNPTNYRIINALREKVLNRIDLEKLEGINSEEEIDNILISLVENEIIHVFENKADIEYFVLLTDLRIEKTIPEYVFNIIKTNYEQKVASKPILIEYVEILEQECLGDN